MIEAGERLLAEFATDLSAQVEDALTKLGVEVRTKTKVTSIEDGVVKVGDDPIESSTIVWSAGTSATPVAEWLGIKPGKGGRVEVDADLRIPGHPRIRVIGDAALVHGAEGKPLPPLAPVAKQQGAYVAKAIIGQQRGRASAAPFRYHDYGTMATIGRAKAVAEFGPLHITGVLAWALWAVAHIFFLVGFRNRFMVSAQWALSFATNQRPNRIIAWHPKVHDHARTGDVRHVPRGSDQRPDLLGVVETSRRPGAIQ